MKLKRWLIGIGLVIVAFWISGGLQKHIPGQEDNPALAKVRLCEVATDTHDAFIEATMQDGLVRRAGLDEGGIYVFEVDEAGWAEFPIESQEVLTIAGWCKAANPDGRGVAVVIDAESGEEYAGVVDGEFSLAE